MKRRYPKSLLSIKFHFESIFIGNAVSWSKSRQQIDDVLPACSARRQQLLSMLIYLGQFGQEWGIIGISKLRAVSMTVVPLNIDVSVRDDKPPISASDFYCRSARTTSGNSETRGWERQTLKIRQWESTMELDYTLMTVQ